MPTTNTRESGLETLIIDWLTDKNGYEQGASADYNRECAVDEPRLISDVVTGRVDVQGVAVPEYEVVGDWSNIEGTEVMGEE